VRAGKPPTVAQRTSQQMDDRNPHSNSQFASRLGQLPLPEPARSSGLGSAHPRRPWLSIAVFAGMLSLSAGPLLGYLKRSGESSPAVAGQTGNQATPTTLPVAPLPSQAQPSEPHAMVPAPMLLADKQQAVMALVAEANRALDQGDAPRAEQLFGRVVSLDEDNARAAFGLSRIRLAQGNLSGAEGWIQLAIRKRPRRAAYHTHYAAILQRLGNHDEAREERLRTNSGSESDESDELHE